MECSIYLLFGFLCTIYSPYCTYVHILWILSTLAQKLNQIFFTISFFIFCFTLGNMIERILVSCNNQQDLHEWVDHLHKQTKVTAVGTPIIKPHSVPSHTVRGVLSFSTLPFPLTFSTIQFNASKHNNCVCHWNKTLQIWPIHSDVAVAVELLNFRTML